LPTNNDIKTRQPQVFDWADVSSYHTTLRDKEFYGTITLQYQKGSIVLLRHEETIKPMVRDE